MTNEYVVGVDGSSASRAALAWALARAARGTQHAVRLVHVLDDEAGLIGRDYRQEMERTGLRMLESTLIEARALYPALSLTGSAIHGSVPWELSHAATSEDLLVIGTRRAAPSTGAVLGSRSVQIASITPAMLAVIPSRDFNSAGPVVVGIGLREPLGPAVVRGAREAAIRGLPLILVTAVSEGDSDRPKADDRALTAVSLDEARQLALDVAPDVRVSTNVVSDEAGHALLSAADQASLLVLGPSRAFGTAVSPIGTVTQSVLLNAPCPVMVSRHGGEER